MCKLINWVKIMINNRLQNEYSQQEENRQGAYTLEDLLEIGKKANRYARDPIKKGCTQIENNDLPPDLYDHLTQGIGDYAKGIGIRGEIWQLQQEKMACGQSPLLAFYESVIITSKKYGLGNCSELAFRAFDYILNYWPELSAQVSRILNGDHVFVIVNWEDIYVVIDPWSNSVFSFDEISQKLKDFKTEYGFDLALMREEDLNQITDFSTVQTPTLIQCTDQKGNKHYQCWGLRGYDLALMSNKKLNKNIIEFQCEENGMRYRFIDLDNIEKNGFIQWDEDALANFPRKDEEILISTNKNKLLPILLDAISKANHTYLRNEWRLAICRHLEKSELAELLNFNFEKGNSIFMHSDHALFKKLQACHPAGRIISKNRTIDFDGNVHELTNEFPTWDLTKTVISIFINTEMVRAEKIADLKNRDVQKIPDYYVTLMETFSGEAIKLIAILVKYNHELEVEKNRLIEKYGDHYENIAIIQRKQEAIISEIVKVDTIMQSIQAEYLLDMKLSPKYQLSQLLSMMYNEAIRLMAEFSGAEGEKLFSPHEFKIINNLLGNKSNSQKNIENIIQGVYESVKKPAFSEKILINKSEYDHFTKIVLPVLSQLIKKLDTKGDYYSAFSSALEWFFTQIAKIEVGIDTSGSCTHHSLLRLCIQRTYRQMMKSHYSIDQNRLQEADLPHMVIFYFELYTSLPMEKNEFVNQLFITMYPNIAGKVADFNEFINQLFITMCPDIAGKVADFVAAHEKFPVPFDMEAFKVFCNKQNREEIDHLLLLCKFSENVEQFNNALLSQEFSSLYLRLINAGFIYHSDIVQMDDQCLQNIKDIVQARKNSLDCPRFVLASRSGGFFSSLLASASTAIPVQQETSLVSQPQASSRPRFDLSAARSSGFFSKMLASAAQDQKKEALPTVKNDTAKNDKELQIRNVANL